ncbi:hypothetical protein ABZT51_08905 [Streptomyces sp. NPDC005373]
MAITTLLHEGYCATSTEAIAKRVGVTWLCPFRFFLGKKGDIR